MDLHLVQDNNLVQTQDILDMLLSRTLYLRERFMRTYDSFRKSIWFQ